MIFYRQREEVLKAARRLAKAGLVTLSSGNVSLRLAEDKIAITPAAIPYEKLAVEDIVVVDNWGHLWEGEVKPSSEAPLHCLILRERPDIKAVVHTHSPFAQAFAVARREIPAITVESALVGTIPLSPPGQPGSLKLGEDALKVLNKYNSKACLLANHGLLAIGGTLAEAYTVAQRSEEIAAVYYRALQLGGAHTINQEDGRLLERESK